MAKKKQKKATVKVRVGLRGVSPASPEYVEHLDARLIELGFTVIGCEQLHHQRAQLENCMTTGSEGRMIHFLLANINSLLAILEPGHEKRKRAVRPDKKKD